jgi:hypothetical protein
MMVKHHNLWIFSVAIRLLITADGTGTQVEGGGAVGCGQSPPEVRFILDVSIIQLRPNMAIFSWIPKSSMHVPGGRAGALVLKPRSSSSGSRHRRSPRARVDCVPTVHFYLTSCGS